MPRIVHFEIPADDPERAVKFYQDVFGWKFQKWEGPMEYWLVTTGPDGQPGINGGLLRRPHPGAGTVNTLDVESVDAAVASVAVEDNGNFYASRDPLGELDALSHGENAEIGLTRIVAAGDAGTDEASFDAVGRHDFGVKGVGRAEHGENLALATD